MLIETEANLITQAHYTDFPGVWGGLTSMRRGATSSFYGFDQQSNSRILVSPAGVVTDAYLYKAFGEELAVSGSTVNPLRFGGLVGYWRDEAERLYVRRRVLRTDEGRWMSRDPIGFWGGDWNLYGYAGNNPVIFNDPSGTVTIFREWCMPQPPQGFGCKTGRPCYITCFSDHNIAYAGRKGCPKHGKPGVCATYCSEYGDPSWETGGQLTITTGSGVIFHKCRICDCGKYSRYALFRPICWIDVWQRNCSGFPTGWHCIS